MRRGLATAEDVLPRPQAVSARAGPSLLRRLVLHAACLGIAAVAYCAHEHYRLVGAPSPALASLLVAGGFGLAPLRALVGTLLAVEGKVLHLVHGIGGLAFVGLTGAGVLSGGPLLTQAATSPFAIMGAAEALMHQDHPRSREQAAALRRFAATLPELRGITTSGDLAAPANARRAVAVLSDVLGSAQALGETELRANPEFQSALHRTTARVGISLALDAADQAIGKLGETPAGAPAVPDLRRRLAAARKALAE